MKNMKAFTLVELLVVIAIIAVLLALLIPSLGRAKEVADRIVCGAIVKNIATASNTYSGTYDGWFVPAGHVGAGNPAQRWALTETNYDNGARYWFQNEAFRSYIKIDDYQQVDLGSDYDNSWLFPKELLCPSDRISKKKKKTQSRMSYGYNNTDWRPWSQSYTTVGYKGSTVTKPAETLNFIDSIGFWVDLNGAHYLEVWDVVKNMGAPDPEWSPVELNWGTVMYRHTEGALVGFYDGHAQWLKKADIFDIEGYYADPERLGMWTASGRMSGNPGWRRW